MSDDHSIQQAAAYVAKQYEARQPIDIMVQEFAPRTIEAAYAVQSACLHMLLTSKGPVGGYKIASTNPASRQRSGVSGPCASGVFARQIYHSPATFDSADYHQFCIECEVGVRLASDLPAAGAPYNRNSVADAIEWLCTAFELIDRRESASGSGAFAPDIKSISTLSNAGAVLGEPVTDWHGIDLAASRGTMTINGELVSEGYGSNVMGHPLEALAWLANLKAAQDDALQAGMFILTGTLTSLMPLAAGDTATIAIEGLGEASLTLK
jgi:2-keto-4-pentenoate hydratase